jgi:hypothetical protein
LQGFASSFILWLAVVWYDALILDCLWFCRSRRVRISGTEDMTAVYGDRLFHIRASVRGTLLGLVLSVPVGLLVLAAAALR